MTSNQGSELIDPTADEADATATVMAEVRTHFRPEFLNRVDDIVVFHRLSQEHVRQIVEIQVGLLRKRLEGKRIDIGVTAAAADWLAEEGYDPIYGARPLKRLLQRTIADRLAVGLLDGTFTEGQTIKVDTQDGDLVLAS